MSAVATVTAAAFAWVLILGAAHAVTALVSHEHVPGPPTGRCVGCGASIDGEVAR